MARNPLDRLARAAARIDRLNKEAGKLAGRMLRSSRPETLERQTREGKQVEQRLRKAEQQFREAERSLLRTTPRERKARQREEHRARKLREAEKIQVPLVTQTFTVRGSYRKKKNHGLAVEVVLTYVGLPILPTKAGDNKVRDAVRSLANGSKPAGWEVALVEYGPTIERRSVRNPGELQQVARALNAMPDSDLHIEAGEHD